MREKLTTNAKLLIAALVLVVLTAVYIIGFLFVKGKAVDIAILQAEATERLESSNHVAKVQNTLRSLEADKKQLQSYFVTPEEIPGFLALLEEFAISLGAVAEVADVSEKDNQLIVRLTVKGDFENLYNYGIFLEHVPYNITVEDFFLQTVSSGGVKQVKDNLINGGWVSDITISLNSYIAKEAEEKN